MAAGRDIGFVINILVIYLNHHPNWFRGFGRVGVRNLASPINFGELWTVRLLNISPTTWTVRLQIAHFVYKTARIKSYV